MDKVYEDLLEILNGLHPEVDFETCETLIDDKIFDSFDIVSLIADINEEFMVTIPVEDIVPKNFNSAKAIYTLISGIIDEEF